MLELRRSRKIIHVTTSSHDQISNACIFLWTVMSMTLEPECLIGEPELRFSLNLDPGAENRQRGCPGEIGGRSKRRNERLVMACNMGSTRKVAARLAIRVGGNEGPTVAARGGNGGPSAALYGSLSWPCVNWQSCTDCRTDWNIGV